MVSVGLNYQGELRNFIAEHIDRLDYLEVVPDITWTDLGPGHDDRYVDDRTAVTFLREVAGHVPLVAHSIGLSIASAHRFRTEHVEQIRRWNDRFDFLWHSDHLGYNIVLDEDGSEFTVGVPLPLPLVDELLDLVVDRASHVRDELPKPFLLENNSAYVRVSEDQHRWAEFLNLLCERSGCGLLLDLHNLYVDDRNGTEQVEGFLAEIDLRHVVEIHVAGGLMYNGYYLDSHSDVVPEPVWDLTDQVVPVCPNLRGITFELLGSWHRNIGDAPVLATLDRMHEVAA